MIGFGNSSCDLAVDASQTRIDINITIRLGQPFQPKTLFALGAGAASLFKLSNMANPPRSLVPSDSHKNSPFATALA